MNGRVNKAIEHLKEYKFSGRAKEALEIIIDSHGELFNALETIIEPAQRRWRSLPPEMAEKIALEKARLAIENATKE